DLVQLEWLDDGNDQFHECVLSRVSGTGLGGGVRPMVQARVHYRCLRQKLSRDSARGTIICGQVWRQRICAARIAVAQSAEDIVRVSLTLHPGYDFAHAARRPGYAGGLPPLPQQPFLSDRGHQRAVAGENETTRKAARAKEIWTVLRIQQPFIRTERAVKPQRVIKTRRH